ncbi:hypothetical protein CC2G_008956 [Coprinopsis cinerea AmutBmut pab1-1]|nr:hypothetical protein CC2G_008956 [Coprinopsis cinerea AmutBmut pab1-1]
MPEAFERWIDAGIFSRQASGEIGNWKDLVYPLGATKKKEVLEKIWKGINLNYIKEAGIDIDRLWALDESLTFKPQWSSYWFEKLAEDSDEEDEDINGLPRAKGQKKKLLALKGPDDDDSADSMPALQSVSNSSDDDDYSEIDSDEEDDDDDYETGESDYDTDEEDEIRELIREAMEAGHEVDWFDSTPADPELDPLKADEKKGNPFLKALGSLRGRLFKSDPKVKPTAARTEPRPNARGAFRATPTGVPKPVPKTAPPKPTPASAKQQQQQQQAPASHKTTMEEVEDEDAVTPSAGKKKKKKKPKKKRTGDEAEAPDSPRPAAAQAAPTSPTSPTLGRSTIGASASTLNIPVETTQAQSSHSYLKQLESDFQQKAKIKSRPDHASIFSGSIHETKKGGLLSKMGFGKKEEDHGDKNPKYTWFSRLSKKATDSMHQLLKTSEDAGRQPAPMKWETFLKLMREMGFEYDPSTAGSSVRFDPPDKRDRSITIHKPHPDPTLNPIMLRNIGKRLKRYYGWNEEDFIKQTQEISSRK